MRQTVSETDDELKHLASTYADKTQKLQALRRASGKGRGSLSLSPLEEVLKPEDVKKGRTAVRAMNKRLVSEYEKSGITVHVPSAAEKAAFKKATAGVHAKFLGSASAKGKELYNLLKSNR